MKPWNPDARTMGELTLKVFQSSPVPKDGRYIKVRRMTTDDRESNLPHIWRYIHGSPPFHRKSIGCFQEMIKTIQAAFLNRRFVLRIIVGSPEHRTIVKLPIGRWWSFLLQV